MCLVTILNQEQMSGMQRETVYKKFIGLLQQMKKIQHNQIGG